MLQGTYPVATVQKKGLGKSFRPASQICKRIGNDPIDFLVQPTLKNSPLLSIKRTTRFDPELGTVNRCPSFVFFL